MKKIASFLLVIILAFQAHGQFKGLSITGGIGTYNLTDLADYQALLVTRLPVEVTQFSAFPVYTNVRMSLFQEGRSGLKYGFTYAYSATGAHANYTDFSGSLNLNQTLSAYQLGLTASYPFLTFDLPSNKIDFSLYGDLRMAYVRDKVNINISTLYYYEDNSVILSVVSPLTEIGLEGMLHLKKVSLGLEGGYLYDFGRQFNFGEQTSLAPTVSLATARDLRSEMSGFRLGIKMIFIFNQLISEE